MMTPRRRQLCKPIARGSRCSLARKCLKDNQIKKYITKGLGILLRKDIAQLCSDDSGIMKHLTTLHWEELIQMMQVKAPTLLSVLRSVTKTKGKN